MCDYDKSGFGGRFRTVRLVQFHYQMKSPVNKIKERIMCESPSVRSAEKHGEENEAKEE